MTTKSISKAIGMIDDAFIEEAEFYRVKDRDRGILRFAAACVAVVILSAAIPLLRHASFAEPGDTAAVNPGAIPSQARTIVALNVTPMPEDADMAKFCTEEYWPWSAENMAPFTDAAAPATATVEFDGVTYTGEYLHTRVLGYHPYRSNVYGFDGGEFTVNSVTGELGTISFAQRKRAGATQEECELDAKRIAAEYGVGGTWEMSAADAGLYRTVTFTKRAFENGVGTLDRIYMEYSADGRLTFFDKSLLGMLDGGAVAESVARLTGDTAGKIAGSKLAGIYGGALVSSELKGRTAAPLLGGGVGVVYEYEAELGLKSPGTDEVRKTRTFLLLTFSRNTEVTGWENYGVAADAGNSIERADAGDIGKYMTWDAVTSVLGRPTEIMESVNGKLHVRYRCRDIDARGLIIVYGARYEYDSGGRGRVVFYVEEKYFI